MDLTNIKHIKGSEKKRKRIGRGQGSGYGGTSTKGNNGSQSRSGYKRNYGYEGGQMPIYRRIPKFGFKNINRKEFTPVNIDTLQKIADEKKITAINPDILAENGITSKSNLIKILGRGNLKAKLTVEAHSFSKSAIKTIEEKGGKIIKIQS
jgi:large subunit ribosomal protein L15